ncbi:MAG: hypothetical protein R6U96_03085 [Promethearchaeia archaeon]
MAEGLDKMTKKENMKAFKQLLKQFIQMRSAIKHLMDKFSYQRTKGVFSQFFSMKDPAIWNMLMNYYKQTLDVKEGPNIFDRLSEVDQDNIKEALEAHLDSEDHEIRTAAEKFLRNLERKKKHREVQEIKTENGTVKKLRRFWTPPSAIELYADFVDIGVKKPKSDLDEEKYKTALLALQNKLTDRRLSCNKCANYQQEKQYCGVLKEFVAPTSICVKFQPNPKKFK